jgi:pyruvate ferredoxin oxidoreductase delta subunit
MVGGIVYEIGSTTSNKTGSWRSMRPQVDRQKCTGCRRCEMVCPDMAIRVTGKAEVNYDYCKGCGICARECPVKAIVMVLEKK